MGDDQLSEKIDIFGLSAAFFFLLAENRPYRVETGVEGELSDIEKREMIAEGIQPAIPHYAEKNLNAAAVAIKQAMFMSRIYDVEKRPTAREIANTLIRASLEIKKSQDNTSPT